jgi:hypothetical protein
MNIEEVKSIISNECNKLLGEKFCRNSKDKLIEGIKNRYKEEVRKHVSFIAEGDKIAPGNLFTALLTQGITWFPAVGKSEVCINGNTYAYKENTLSIVPEKPLEYIEISCTVEGKNSESN